MTPTELSQTLEIMGSFAKIVDTLGISGIVTLIVASPVLMTCALYFFEYRRNQMMNQSLSDVRTEFREAIKAVQSSEQRAEEVHQEKMLLQKIANSLMDVVISNTAAMTKLTTLFEDRRRKGE